jgi:hypothetical protein
MADSASSQSVTRVFGFYCSKDASKGLCIRKRAGALPFVGAASHSALPSSAKGHMSSCQGLMALSVLGHRLSCSICEEGNRRTSLYKLRYSQ